MIRACTARRTPARSAARRTPSRGRLPRRRPQERSSADLFEVRVINDDRDIEIRSHQLPFDGVPAPPNCILARRSRPTVCQNIPESINGTQASNVCNRTRHGSSSWQMAFLTGTIIPRTIRSGSSLEISSTVHFPQTSLLLGIGWRLNMRRGLFWGFKLFVMSPRGAGGARCKRSSLTMGKKVCLIVETRTTWKALNTILMMKDQSTHPSLPHTTFCTRSVPMPLLLTARGDNVICGKATPLLA